MTFGDFGGGNKYVSFWGRLTESSRAAANSAKLAGWSSHRFGVKPPVQTM
jgi:hypothetical protein